MKLTKDRLKKIIKEELEELMQVGEAAFPPPPPPPTKELKPGDQVQFKDPDSPGSSMVQGKIIANDQALKLLDQYSARNTPDSRRYGYDDATKLQRQPDSYFFINPLRTIRQTGVGQPHRSFYVIDKKILTKIGATASSSAQPSDTPPGKTPPPPPGKTPPPPPRAAGAPPPPPPSGGETTKQRLEKQLATFERYGNIPAYKKRADEIRAQIAGLQERKKR